MRSIVIFRFFSHLSLLFVYQCITFLPLIFRFSFYSILIFAIPKTSVFTPVESAKPLDNVQTGGAFFYYTFPYTVRTFPSSSTLLDCTLHTLPSSCPHTRAFSLPPTSPGTVITVISSTSPLFKSKEPISSP